MDAGPGLSVADVKDRDGQFVAEHGTRVGPDDPLTVSSQGLSQGVAISLVRRRGRGANAVQLLRPSLPVETGLTAYGLLAAVGRMGMTRPGGGV